ncbi:hypothetical protein [Aneurinibacillus sp. XH2]|uniref:hypothetical protein n=1 Tax=Aneurinibacillus sp. XH2 TaxID=1450761 RepID=UPI00138F467F|nr:hypothetical protein [Aneurinibacillus sp. XH2]
MANVDNEYWDRLEVNHEKITEANNWERLHIDVFLEKLKPEEIIDIAKIMGIKTEKKDKGQLVKEIRVDTNVRYLAFLREFILRKKKAIIKYYNRIFARSKERYDSSAFVQLTHLFYAAPSYLFEVFVVHEWMLKGTDYLYNFDGKFTQGKLNDLAIEDTYHKALVNQLYQATGKEIEYRIVACCNLSDKEKIFLIHKLAKDSKKPDFDLPKRLKEVGKLLFSVNLDEKILHIKAKTEGEKRGIRNYIEGDIGASLREIKQQVYEEYDENKLEELFSLGNSVTGKEPEDFVINKIVFSNSLLSKSPQVIIQLPKSDIWPSVIDAVKLGVIKMDSLSNISQLSITTHNHTKSVRSIILDEANVMFKLDDSGLDEEVRQGFITKFRQKFGLPLNQPIKNKFEKGYADKIDYILRLDSKEQISSDLSDLLEELKRNNLIKEELIKLYKCSNYECGRVTKDKSDFDEGCKCGNTEYHTIENTELITDKKKITSLVEGVFDKYIAMKHECAAINSSTIKISGTQYNFKKFVYKKNPYQVLVSEKILSKKVIEAIERQLIPTIIIHFGVDKYNVNLTIPNTIQTLDFGIIYRYRDDNEKLEQILDEVVDNLAVRTKNQITSVATKSNENLRWVQGKVKELKDKYSPSDFEDDVFPIIKEMLPNSEKWGKEYAGHSVPEGIFALQFYRSGSVSTEERYIFTYDCKLTTDEKGYDLDADEKRKASGYVQEINKLRTISSYCSTEEVSSHIFISNKFKENQIEAMANHFIKTLAPKHRTTPAFILVEQFVALHSWYRQNMNLISLIPDIFYEELHKLLTPGHNEGYIITEEALEEFFENIMDAEHKYKAIETERITKRLVKK